MPHQNSPDAICNGSSFNARAHSTVLVMHRFRTSIPENFPGKFLPTGNPLG